MSNTFKGTTLTFLPEVHLNCSFIFLPPSAPSPGLGDALFTARKNDSSILLLGTMFSFISRRQQEVVYFLAFLSLCVTFLGHLPKKEEKKKRISYFAFLCLLLFKASRRFDKHPLILSQAAGGWTQPLEPHQANTPLLAPWVTGRWDMGGQLLESSRCAAVAGQRWKQLQAELHFHLLLQTRAAVISHLIMVAVVPLQYVLLQ